MKKATLLIFATMTIGICGRFGVGIAGFCQYENDYSIKNYNQFANTFYGIKCHISAEALPYMFLEPVGVLINNPLRNELAPGIGLRVNVAPRLGKFFLGPFFGFEGDILFYNPSIQFRDAVTTHRLEQYFEDSSPRGIGTGFGGLSIYLGKATSLDCHYQYLYIAKGIGIEMVCAGITFYLNW
uniref:Outer membrane protein beta-barrel domain-containing protein n=1 Tax=candidate division WOR-3 bacterium TaxID=2052148 RepID=A0A7V3VTD8_UNCW3